MSAEVELARLERQVLGVKRIARFRDQVAELRRMLAREDPRLRERVLLLAAPTIGRDLAAAMSAAFDIGISDATLMLAEDRPKDLPKRPTLPIVALAKDAERRIAAELVKARKLARVASTEPIAVLSPVLAAANGLTRDVTTLVNYAGNMGATAVADRAGLATVWVAETNACVECLAYSGRVALPGQTFKGGLTYGRKSYNTEPIVCPPRHPNCRCTVEPLRSPEYAEALRREADRSVLRGFSLESESMKTRIDAADRLVKRGVDAPASVVAYARRAVKAGEFPTRGRP